MSPLEIKSLIVDVPDFPKPGIVFKDITPVLANPAAFRAVTDQLAEHAAPLKCDAVLAIESRGFIIGAPLAQRLGLPLHLVRKRGKLPRAAITVRYELEYGFDHLEMHSDAIRRGGRYLIVDDVIATGGTAAAVASVVAQQGASVAACLFLIELKFLARTREARRAARRQSDLLLILLARARRSVRAVQDELRQPQKGVRALAERAQRADGALLRLCGAAPRAFDAERGRVGRLVVARVAAGVLAERRSVLLDLEQVVANLEYEPDVAREHVEARTLLGAQVAELARHHDGGSDQRAGLAAMNALEAALVDALTLGGHVERLAADHAGGSRGAREPREHFDLRLWSGGELGIRGEHLERERLQRVAGEDRRRFVELPVRRGTAAPQIVVVHRGQVVVHERVGVNQLDGGGDRVERVFGGSDELAARVDEERSHALSAAEHGIAHRVEQSVGDLMVGAQNVGELLVDSAAVVIETLGERLWGGPCYHRGPS